MELLQRWTNVHYSIRNSKYFDYKMGITGTLVGINTSKNVDIAVPLKYLSNVWRTLGKSLINWEVSLTLTWSANCVKTSGATRAANPDTNPAVVGIDAPTNATFVIKDTKLYFPVVTLSTEDDNKLLQQLKTRFKRTIKWNKYRSEISNQPKNSYLNYLIDPFFNKVNSLFVFSFQNEDDKLPFSKY